MRRSGRHAEIALYAAAAGLRAEAAAAVSRALEITVQDDPADRSIAFTKAFAALALSLLGRHRRAAHVLARLCRSTALPPRLEQLVQAVRMINARWALGRYSTDLRAALDRLAACDFGGIGRLIEALPLPETFRGQFAQLTAAEREVLIHMSAGLNSAEVAPLSGQTSETIGALIASLCRKLGCASPRDAVALAKSSDVLGIVAANVR